MCDYNYHLLHGVSHWGSGGDRTCPKGGLHDPKPVPGTVGYAKDACSKCGLVGTCTE